MVFPLFILKRNLTLPQPASAEISKRSSFHHELLGVANESVGCQSA
jgi:hypothetical protein